LQALEQTFQRSLAILLRGQLLAQYQLIEPATEGQESEGLAALNLSA